MLFNAYNSKGLMEKVKKNCKIKKKILLIVKFTTLKNLAVLRLFNDHLNHLIHIIFYGLDSTIKIKLTRSKIK